MIAGSFSFEKLGNVSRFSARVSSSGLNREPATLLFDFHIPVAPPDSIGDPWLAALLFPCMFAGETLEIQGPVTAKLLRGVSQIQEMMHSWFPELLRPIEIKAQAILPTLAPRDGGPCAVFFSGGVDSWYSVDRNRQRAPHLLTVKGFDIPYQDTMIWPEVVSQSGIASREIGLPLVLAETNIRDHVDPGLGAFKRRYEGTDFWGNCYHGSCLAATGLFLQQVYSSVLVPASWQYARLQPWGSHPLLDCFFSNGRLELQHDGADAGRMDKLRVLVTMPEVLKHLRVCPDFTKHQYNCGECEKCQRTMLAMRALGVRNFEQLPFSAGLNLQWLELNPPKGYLRPLYVEILEESRKTNDTELIRCLEVLAGERMSPKREWHKFSSRMKRSIRKRLGKAK